MSEKMEIPSPKFKNGQFVNRIKGNSTGSNGIVQIHGEPRWSEESKQYRYGICYRRPVRKANEMSSSGGASLSWPETDFTEVDDPIDLLIIAKFERDEERRKAKARIAVLDAELRYIKFSLNLVSPINKEGDKEDGC